MGPERYSGVGLAHRLEYVEDLAGVRYAYGVGERDIIYAGLDDPRNDVEHLAASGPALEGVAEDGRDVGPHVDAIFPAAGGDGGEAGEGLVHRPVQVLSAVTLGRRAHEHDLPDARRASPLVAPLVRDQAAIDYSVRRGQPGEHVLGVGELRDSSRGDERGRLEPLEPCGSEGFDQGDLLRGRKVRFFALEPVAGPDLDDLDRCRQVH
jgi:hypothetical protein